MMLLTGKKNPKRNKGFTRPVLKPRPNSLRTGFTLIELILTTTILLVIAALSVPIFKNTYSSLIINLKAQDMAGLMNLARERAIMTRMPYAVKINADENSYRMMALDTKKDKLSPVRDRWGKSFFIPANFKIQSGGNTVKFFPDGTSSGADIVLTDDKGAQKQVHISEKTGEINTVEAQKK
ncbi:MAG: GspH/FimT family pseudopilin [Candidatus Omnitrophica bacterium]|nr:GspH/FimT family pseudopilin [Candidatus Omnitrophota bacterium]